MKLLMIFLALLAFNSHAQQAYIDLKIGPSYWKDTSNEDELEADSSPGVYLAAALGKTYTGDRPFTTRLELEASYRQNNIHDANGSGKPKIMEDRDLHVGALTVNIWPSVPINDYWSWYFGGGGGMARLRGLDDTTWTGAWQVGTGLTYKRFSFGYAYFEIDDTDLDGNKAEYESQGPVLTVSWKL